MYKVFLFNKKDVEMKEDAMTQNVAWFGWKGSRNALLSLSCPTFSHPDQRHLSICSPD